MEEEILWYIGACIFAWCIGYAAGVFHRSFTQVIESAS